MSKNIFSTLALLAVSLACIAQESSQCPAYFGAAPGTLAKVRAHLTEQPSVNPRLTAALKELVADADEALQHSPPSVIEKTKLPPSGDKHDYMSTAPYFWPDPATSNGLPYIRHDGHVNPDSRGSASDHPRLASMAADVETLALAYCFTGKEAYAAAAARQLRIWFLDPATRMNPHLNFAQAVPGLNNGRGTGIIEGRNLSIAADATALLAGSPAWPARDQKALKTWLASYLDWLLTSKNGKEEAAAQNNHGTLYDVQVMRLALVLGRPDLAKQIAETARQKRIAIQIEPDGRQPLELARSTSFGYSRFNLEALFSLATLAQHVDVDLWHFQTNHGRSLRKAFDFLLPYIQDPARRWPYEQIKKTDPDGFAPLLRQAALVYHEPRYERILNSLKNVDDHRFELLCPVLDQAL